MVRGPRGRVGSEPGARDLYSHTLTASRCNGDYSLSICCLLSTVLQGLNALNPPTLGVGTVAPVER